MLAMSLRGGHFGDDTVTVPGTDASTAADLFQIGDLVTQNNDPSTIWTVSAIRSDATGTRIADLTATGDTMGFASGIPLTSLTMAATTASMPDGTMDVTMPTDTPPINVVAAAVPFYKKGAFWAVTGLATAGIVTGLIFAVRSARH